MGKEHVKRKEKYSDSIFDGRQDFVFYCDCSVDGFYHSCRVSDDICIVFLVFFGHSDQFGSSDFVAGGFEPGGI